MPKPTRRAERADDGAAATARLYLGYGLARLLADLSAARLEELCSMRRRVEAGRLSRAAYAAWTDAFCTRAVLTWQDAPGRSLEG